MLTLSDRARSYAQAFRKWPASWPHVVTEAKDRQVLYATWVIGNDYRNRSDLYGAYPAGYLARVLALFQDVPGRLTLHAFSGSLPPCEATRLDCNIARRPDVVGDVCQASSVLRNRIVANGEPFRLVLADPPYTPLDAEKYGTPMVNKRKAIAALHDVTAPGAFLAWLDTCWPMHSKRQWVTVGRILVQRSTQHRVRLLTIFQRVP